ncbi:HYC_CC_PP family protein [Chitinophaga sp. CC14]|uniref:HYC_CC_PP family protein n=1 Tax=Chitinophaga sp. CC14 TaxID=3029199 RepID=UPI003B982721
MRSINSIILALFYLCFTNGVTVYQHYCMGELENVSIFHGGDSSCIKCGMKKHTATNNGCCKDVVLNSEKSGDFHINSSVSTGLNVPVLPTLLQFYLNESILYPQNSVTGIYIPHGPPLIKNLPLFLIYDNFRI